MLSWSNSTQVICLHWLGEPLNWYGVVIRNRQIGIIIDRIGVASDTSSARTSRVFSSVPNIIIILWIIHSRTFFFSYFPIFLFFFFYIRARTRLRHTSGTEWLYCGQIWLVVTRTSTFIIHARHFIREVSDETMPKTSTLIKHR